MERFDVVEDVPVVVGEAEEVLEAMEQAIQKAARSRYGHENDVRAEIDRKSGEINLARYLEVADPVENEATQIPIEEAKRLNPEAEVGDFLTEALPPVGYNSPDSILRVVVLPAPFGPRNPTTSPAASENSTA